MNPQDARRLHRLETLSNRSLERAYDRELRKAKGSKTKSGLHGVRLGWLQAEMRRRADSPVYSPVYEWSMKPSDVIGVWLESHGIGPTIATRVKRKRRAFDRAWRDVENARWYLDRVLRRGASDEVALKAKAAVAKAVEALNRVKSVSVTRLESAPLMCAVTVSE